MNRLQITTRSLWQASPSYPSVWKCCRLERFAAPIYIQRLIYRVIRKSLCTWLLYCNHQVHRDFLITLYFYKQANDRLDNCKQLLWKYFVLRCRVRCLGSRFCFWGQRIHISVHARAFHNLNCINYQNILFIYYYDPLPSTHFRCRRLLLHLITINGEHKHTIVLLWTKDRPVTETSTCTTHNIHKKLNIHAPGGIRTLQCQ